jgi:uncharacterized protein (DUF433 family)
VLRPGQEVLAQLGDVLSPFTNAAGLTIPDFSRPRPKLRVDADVLAGYPVVAGTRVPFDLVAGLIAGGVPAERVGEYYPGVGADAAAQAADYAVYVDQVARRQAA